MLTTPSSTVISIKCRLLRHSDFWVPVWDKDLNEKAAGIRFVSEENVTVSDKAAAASSKAGAALTFKGCPNLQHSRTEHISFWLLSLFLIKIVRRWEMVLLLSNMKMPWWSKLSAPCTRLLQCILIKINMLSLGLFNIRVSASQRCPCG